jgi:hypothetical protein
MNRWNYAAFHSREVSEMIVENLRILADIGKWDIVYPFFRALLESEDAVSGNCPNHQIGMRCGYLSALNQFFTVDSFDSVAQEYYNLLKSSGDYTVKALVLEGFSLMINPYPPQFYTQCFPTVMACTYSNYFPLSSCANRVISKLLDLHKCSSTGDLFRITSDYLIHACCVQLKHANLSQEVVDLLRAVVRSSNPYSMHWICSVIELVVATMMRKSIDRGTWVGFSTVIQEFVKKVQVESPAVKIKSESSHIDPTLVGLNDWKTVSPWLLQHYHVEAMSNNFENQAKLDEAANLNEIQEEEPEQQEESIGGITTSLLKLLHQVRSFISNSPPNTSNEFIKLASLVLTKLKEYPRQINPEIYHLLGVLSLKQGKGSKYILPSTLEVISTICNVSPDYGASKAIEYFLGDVVSLMKSGSTAALTTLSAMLNCARATYWNHLSAHQAAFASNAVLERFAAESNLVYIDLLEGCLSALFNMNRCRDIVWFSISCFVASNPILRDSDFVWSHMLPKAFLRAANLQILGDQVVQLRKTEILAKLINREGVGCHSRTT